AGGQGLGDQHVGHARAVCGNAVDVLGDVDGGDARLGGLGDEVARIGRRLVCVVGRGPQHFLGEFVEGLHDQLLVIVGRQVEIVLAARLEPGGAAAQV